MKWALKRVFGLDLDLNNGYNFSLILVTFK